MRTHKNLVNMSFFFLHYTLNTFRSPKVKPTIFCHIRWCRLRGELLRVGQQLNEDGLRVLAVAVRQLPSAEEALQAAAETGSAAAHDPTPAGPAAAPGGDSLEGGQREAAAIGDGSPRSTAMGHMASWRSSGASTASGAPGWSVEDERGMTFVGFLAFLDPPKASARQAVVELQGRGGAGCDDILAPVPVDLPAHAAAPPPAAVQPQHWVCPSLLMPAPDMHPLPPSQPQGAHRGQPGSRPHRVPAGRHPHRTHDNR
jgi:hypothetical protein